MEIKLYHDDNIFSIIDKINDALKELDVEFTFDDNDHEGFEILYLKNKGSKGFLLETLLTIFLEGGLISRGVYADLLKIDRCDIDDKIKEVKERIDIQDNINGNL